MTSRTVLIFIPILLFFAALAVTAVWTERRRSREKEKQRFADEYFLGSRSLSGKLLDRMAKDIEKEIENEYRVEQNSDLLMRLYNKWCHPTCLKPIYCDSTLQNSRFAHPLQSYK